MRPFLLALFCLLPAVTLPAAADPVPAPHPLSLRSDILYTHRGEFVQVSPMRPLTLNAHVEQFAYDPLGLEIAYTGSEPQGENTVHFAKTIDARSGHELSRYALTAPTDASDTALSLIGWSASGKYLLLKKFAPALSHPETAVTEFLRWDLSTNPPTIRVIQPQSALPPEQQSADLTGSADCYSSPTGRWLMFTQSIHTLKENGEPLDRNAYVLYDPERDTFRLLPLLPNVSAYSWADNTHLKWWQLTETKQLDVMTGEISSVTKPPDYAAPAVSAKYPDLSLDTERRNIDDQKNTGAQAPSDIVWIRRTPFGKLPLGAAAAGVMQAGAASGNGAYDVQSLPQASWSPTGKQVAFVANDDLYVTNLIASMDLLPHEKMAVGLKLSCEEEQQLALSNLKQIGLALIQYAQDFDEHFPPTKDIEQTLYPYLKTHDVFSIGSTHWVYHGASNASLNSIDDPAETVQATMDLPCAHLALYFDGHVRAFPKAMP